MDTHTRDLAATPDAEAPGSRHRDAETTRQLLLAAALTRFARDGFTGATVRDIAADAGVNMALINRYFTSKEGLFEACLQASVEGIERRNRREVTVDDMLQTMIRHIASPLSSERSAQLMLLLRSSGDARANEIRLNSLRDIVERMASVAGWRRGDANTEDVMLRAELALATSLGILLLRTTTELRLASAGDEELRAPLGEVFSTLLTPR